MQVSSMADHKKLTLMKQQGSLTFASKSVLKIVQSTQKEFKQNVIESESGIVFHKNINLKLQSAVLSRIGPEMLETSSEHFFDHRIGQKADHSFKPLEESGCKVSGCSTKDLCKAVHNHNSSPKSDFWVASLNKTCSIQNLVKTNSEIPKEKQNYST